jgi:hypothetical protein
MVNARLFCGTDLGFGFKSILCLSLIRWGRGGYAPLRYELAEQVINECQLT